jgi:catechol 2,3-dioxygenase-like lactoylglutathione lyase family enzyme
MVRDLEWHIDFFNNVFGMHIIQSNENEFGFRQIWFDDGLQLITTDGELYPDKGLLNHIAIAVPDVTDCLEKAHRYPVTVLPKGANWIVLPTGLCIEILTDERESNS